jgi:hypothetical protein
VCVCVGGVVSGEKRSRCTIASLHSSRLFASRFRVVCAVPPGSQLQKNRRVVAWPKPRHGGSFKEIKWNLKKLAFLSRFWTKKNVFPKKYAFERRDTDTFLFFFIFLPKWRNRSPFYVYIPPPPHSREGELFRFVSETFETFLYFLWTRRLDGCEDLSNMYNSI